MSLSKQILVVLFIALVVLKWAAFGWIISKHGEEKESKYNAYFHLFVTCVFMWAVYELYND